MTTENKFREFTVIECQDETYQALKYRKSHDQLVNSFHTIEIAAVEQLKAENLLLSDDRELYMRHRDILIDALRVVESHNGINTHYPIVYATTKQALRDVGEM